MSWAAGLQSATYGSPNGSLALPDEAGVGRVVGIWGWRNLRLVQPARAGVVAPAEITP